MTKEVAYRLAIPPPAYPPPPQPLRTRARGSVAASPTATRELNERIVRLNRGVENTVATNSTILPREVPEPAIGNLTSIKKLRLSFLSARTRRARGNCCRTLSMLEFCFDGYIGSIQRTNYRAEIRSAALLGVIWIYGL